MKRRQATRSGTWAASSAATWSGSYSGAGPIDPISLNPYLYFDARVNVNTEGGDVDLWYPQWYGDPAPSNGLSDHLDQGTAEWQPTHDDDGYIQFDNVDTRLEYDSPVEQAGVLICATDNGIFAYEVDADSVDEITALGFETGYFQTLKLYAMTLLPATVSDVQIAGVIQFFEEELGATRNPTGDLSNYWRGRTDLVTPKFAALDFSGVTNIRACWLGCSSLTEFPGELDLSSGTNFGFCWQSCTSLTEFPGTLDLSSGTSFASSWQSCTSLSEFPGTLDLSSGTNFNASWYGCTSLENFPSELDLSSGTNFSQSWQSCTSLEEFPGTLDLSSGTDFNNCWLSCTSLEEFPGTLDLSSGTNFSTCWYNCNSLTEFPGTLDLSSGTNFNYSWGTCSSLTEFPSELDLSSGTNFSYCWYNCNSLTEFPSELDLSSGTNFSYCWKSCTSLEDFPALDLSSGTSFYACWHSCSSLESFPSDLDLSSGTNFAYCWYGCSSLENFPSELDLSSGTNFYLCWYNCTSLEDFPANLFDYWSPGTAGSYCFQYAWDGCSSLTATSVENILNSIATSGVDAPASGSPDITIDYDDGTGPPDITSAVTTLKACSPAWTITLNGVAQ